MGPTGNRSGALVRAILLDGFGGPEQMRAGEAPMPTPSSRQVLIRITATSVNRPDVLQRQGHYPPPPGESEILGLEAAGTIEALGADVRGLSRGQRVAALLGGGGYAELAAVDARHVIPVPDSISFEEAACICETYITAYLNLFIGARLVDGESVLLHGGGGGVTTAAMQLVSALAPASQMIVTASPAKLRRVADLGARPAVDYRSEDFAEAVHRATGGRGVDVVLDHIGAAYLDRNMRSLAIGGRIALIGIMSGRKAEIDLGRLLVKRQEIIGSVLWPRPPDEKAAIIARFREAVMPLFAQRRIVPLIDRVYPLEEAEAAHRRMESGEHFGKIVLAL
jgi:NADPH:quinone reductase